MRCDEMNFRWAEPGDIEGIWDLLHASYLTWSNEEIRKKLKFMRILFHGETLAGLYYHLPGEEGHFVIHPIYPEVLTKEVIDKMI